MALRKLDREETDFMRAYVQEGVGLGETEEQIKARRRELKDLFECSLSQVSGAVAWKNEGGDRLELKPLELPNAEPTTPTEADENIEQTVAEPDLPRGTAGSDFNYENPEKNEWRDFVLEYVCRHIPAEERAVKKVLCLGGASNLEPRAYIANGFSPANIMSVEKEEGVLQEFNESATRMGIQTFAGEVKNLRSSERFDVVSLDYTGPIGTDKLNDIQSILLSDEAVVAINFEQKRESRQTRKAAIFTQEQIRAVDDGDARKSAGAICMNFAGAIEQRTREIDGQSLSHEEWEQQRKKLMASSISLFGRHRTDNFIPGLPHSERMITNSDPEEFNQVCGKFAGGLHEAFKKKWKVRPPEFIGCAGLGMMHLFQLCLTKTPLIQELEYYKYHSKHEGGSSPFQTICAKVHVPDFYARKQKIVKQFGRILECVAGSEDDDRLVIRDMDGRFQFSNPVPHICFTRDNFVRASVDMNEFMQTYIQYKEVEGQHPQLSMFGDEQPITDQRERGLAQEKEMKEYWAKVRKKEMKGMRKKMQPRYRHR